MNDTMTKPTANELILRSLQWLIKIKLDDPRALRTDAVVAGALLHEEIATHADELEAERKQ